MAKAMTKSEIAATLAEKVGITKKQVSAFFAAQAELAYKQAKNQFVVPGLGKLVLATSAPRESLSRVRCVSTNLRYGAMVSLIRSADDAISWCACFCIDSCSCFRSSAIRSANAAFASRRFRGMM